MRRRWLLVCGAAPAALLVGYSSQGSETTTYTYDALGRLVATTRTGGPSSGVNMATCFDRAGNRIRYDTLTTAPAVCPTPTPTPTPG
jgi:YD repeat-containing protein